MECIKAAPGLFAVAVVGLIYVIATGWLDRPKPRNTDIHELFRTIIFPPRNKS